MPVAEQEMRDLTFDAGVFAEQSQVITLDGFQVRETVVQGLRNFDLMRTVFDRQGVDQIGVIGYSSQGSAQPRNIRDSLEISGSNTSVVIGLRDTSPRREEAREHGFRVATPEEVIATSALTIMLMEDRGLVKDGQRYFGLARQGAVIGHSHGFDEGHLGTLGKTIQSVAPQIRGSIGICPKGMGPVVRTRYEEGTGTNSSYYVSYGHELDMTELALAWGIGIGSPWILRTTAESERNSDLTGERAVLLGLVGALAETVREWKLQNGADPERATLESVEVIFGTVSKLIDKGGLTAVFEALTGEQDRQEFINAYNIAYKPFYVEIEKLYRNVSSGREVAEVAEDDSPKLQISAAPTWTHYEELRESMDEATREQRAGLDATVAGIYLAAMIAQIDVLAKNGHPPSELANETPIEAVRSLNPVVRRKGFRWMVDNCSDTAQRGYRKWSGNFAGILRSYILPQISGTSYDLNSDDARNKGMMMPDGENYFGAFLDHPIHEAWEKFSALE